MMSYLRMYRDKFVESNDLEYIYMNRQTLSDKFKWGNIWTK